METLNILVVEDKEMNILAALSQLSGHNVFIATNLVEAMKTLGSVLSEQNANVRNKTMQKGISGEYVGGIDVVLTDMHIPGGRVPEYYEFGNETSPVGVMIALRAAGVGVKLVGLMSDSNHHTDAMAAGIDMLNGYGFNPSRPFRINDSKVVFTAAETVPFEHEGRKEWVKDWKALLGGLQSQ